MKADSTINPVFICGTGRSGTSIFTKLLGCHPEVWAFKWESQIFSGIPGLGDLLDSDFNIKLVQRFKDRVMGHLFKRSVRGEYDAGIFEIISIQNLRSAISKQVDSLVMEGDSINKIESCKKFADSIFLPPAKESGAKIWCEKTPRNLLYADAILQIYPEAKFIHVVRDGRDVVSSILKKKFWPVARSSRYPSTNNFGGEVNFDKVVNYWSNLIDIAIDQEARIGKERWLNVRLEDMTSDVDNTFHDIFKFLGIDGGGVVYNELRKYIRPSSANHERWKKDLSEFQANIFIDVSYENLKRFEYL